MKKIIVPIIIIMCFFSAAYANSKNFGLGIMLGEPTGVSGKLWIDKTSAVDGGLSWSFTDKTSMNIHMDYLFHNFNLIHVEKDEFPLYYGIGGRIKFGNETEVGVRIPVGLEYIFKDSPFDIFLEIAPILNLIPATSLKFNGGIGARFYF